MLRLKVRCINNEMVLSRLNSSLVTNPGKLYIEYFTNLTNQGSGERWGHALKEDAPARYIRWWKTAAWVQQVGSLLKSLHRREETAEAQKSGLIWLFKRKTIYYHIKLNNDAGTYWISLEAEVAGPDFRSEIDLTVQKKDKKTGMQRWMSGWLHVLHAVSTSHPVLDNSTVRLIEICIPNQV